MHRSTGELAAGHGRAPAFVPIANDGSASLERLVLPRLGSKKVAAVQAREIHALHVAMSDTPYQANRLLALLSKMFALAVHWGMRGDNPVKGIQRYHEERRELARLLRRVTATADGARLIAE